MSRFILTLSACLLASSAWANSFRFCAPLDGNAAPGQCEVQWACPCPGEPDAEPKGAGCKPVRGPAPSFLLVICGADLGGGRFDCSKPPSHQASYGECAPIDSTCNPPDSVCRQGTYQFPGDGNFTLNFESNGGVTLNGEYAQCLGPDKMPPTEESSLCRRAGGGQCPVVGGPAQKGDPIQMGNIGTVHNVTDVLAGGLTFSRTYTRDIRT